jgi:hypothetical protein
MNSIKIAVALLLDKITGIFSKKEPEVPAVYTQIKVEPVTTTTPAPVVKEPLESKKPKAKSSKKSKKG